MKNLPSQVSRSRLLVYPKFQLRMLAYMGGTAIFVTLINYFAQRYFLAHLISRGTESGLPPGNVYFQFVDEQASLLGTLSLTAGLVSSAAIIAIGLVLSNRVAGPLKRLETHLLGIADSKKNSDGKEKSVHFREKDYFPELADAVNKAFKLE